MDEAKGNVLIGFTHLPDKLLFDALKKEMSLRTRPLTWCGNPPTIPDGLLGRLSVFCTFPLYPGDCHVAALLAMTA